MSTEAMEWVLAREIRPAARKFVAVMIAYAADDEGTCWPKQKRLATQCSLSYDSVRGHVRELEAEGVLTRTPRSRPNGGRSTNEYRVVPFTPSPVDASTPSPVDTSTEHFVEQTEGIDRKNNSPAPAEQESFLPDPVDETWEVYTKAFDKPKAQLTPKVRKWIRDAHEATSVEETRQAILGLAASDYHRENGYVGIDYAIVAKRGQTIESRITMMATKAGVAVGPNGVMTVDQFLEQFPREHVEYVLREIVQPIVTMLKDPDNLSAELEGQRQVRRLRDMGYAPVIEDQRITGYRRS